jgi:hypothetical protein
MEIQAMAEQLLAAAHRIIARQNRALAKAHAALTAISRNAAIDHEWLVPVHAAIAEIEGRSTSDDIEFDQTLTVIRNVMTEG